MQPDNNDFVILNINFSAFMRTKHVPGQGKAGKQEGGHDWLQLWVEIFQNVAKSLFTQFTKIIISYDRYLIVLLVWYTSVQCLPKELSCNRRCCKGSESASEKENWGDPPGNVHPLGCPGERSSKLPGYKEADKGCRRVKTSPMKGPSCIKDEGSQENSQGWCGHQAGRCEAGCKGNASQSSKHEAPAVEGVGEGGHRGRESQWSAEGPSRVAKSTKYNKVL